jgi:acyl dehydratase
MDFNGCGRISQQPFHVDEEAAPDSIFGGLTGSSCHSFARFRS